MLEIILKSLIKKFFNLLFSAQYLCELRLLRQPNTQFNHPRMYSYNNKKELKFGGYYLMLNENQDADNYQILLILLILYLMALMFTFIILSNKWKVFRIWKNKFYSWFLLHNFLFWTILCIGIYWISFYCIIWHKTPIEGGNKGRF